MRHGKAEYRLRAEGDDVLAGYARAIDRQNVELDAAYRVLREAGDINLNVAPSWLEELKSICKRPTKRAVNVPAPAGTRC